MKYSKKTILYLVDPFLNRITPDGPEDYWISINCFLDLHVCKDPDTGHISAYAYAVNWDPIKAEGQTDTSREMCVFNTAGDIPEPHWEGLEK